MAKSYSCNFPSGAEVGTLRKLCKAWLATLGENCSPGWGFIIFLWLAIPLLSTQTEDAQEETCEADLDAHREQGDRTSHHAD